MDNKKNELYEIVEVCPHCDYENVYRVPLEEAGKPIRACHRCGRKIFICSECDDCVNYGLCNWHENPDGSSECYRGRIDAHFAEGDWYYVNQIEYPENIEKEENEKKEEEKPKMKVKIYPVGNKANHEIEGENTSTIVSELVALAARYCESYASDIVYDINEFMNSVVDHVDYEKILLFYDCGVHARKVEAFDEFMDNHSSSGDRAFFRLSYDSEKNVQKLERLTVYVCRF